MTTEIVTSGVGVRVYALSKLYSRNPIKTGAIKPNKQFRPDLWWFNLVLLYSSVPGTVSVSSYVPLCKTVLLV